MEEPRARELLGAAIQPDDSLDDPALGLRWTGDDDCVRLGATIPVETLEAIAWWMRHKTVLAELAEGEVRLPRRGKAARDITLQWVAVGLFVGIVVGIAAFSGDRAGGLIVDSFDALVRLFR